MRTFGNAVRSAAILVLLGCLGFAAENDSALTLPRVSSGIAQLAKLRETGLTEEVMVAYVQNSSIPKPNAEELIYLHERGVSSAVITALLKRNDTPAPTVNFAQAPEQAEPVEQQAASRPIIVGSERAVAQSPTVIHIGSGGYAPRYNESYFAPYFGAPYPGSFYSSSAYLSPIYSVGRGFGHFGRGHFGHHSGHHHSRHGGHQGHHGHRWSGHGRHR